MAQRGHQADLRERPDGPPLDVVELDDDPGRGTTTSSAVVAPGRVRAAADSQASREGRARAGIGTTTGSTPCQPGGAPSSTVTTQSAQPVPRAVQVSQSISMSVLLRESSAR